MSDERYDRSADMRLLELQRQALGVPRRVIESISYVDPDPLTDVSKDEDDTYVQSGTILIAATDARPRVGLIPGALVTVSLSVANDGDEAATNVRVSLPMPVETSYRPGTLAIDDLPGSEDVANELFGNGVSLNDIEPGARSSLTVKLVVEAGSADIILSPQLSATSGAIIGLRAMRLTREAPLGSGLVAERPFYESDEDEHTIEPLAPAAPVPTIAVLQPPEYPSRPVAVPIGKPVSAGPPVAVPPLPVGTKSSIPFAPPAAPAIGTSPVAPAALKPIAPIVSKPIAPVAAKTVAAIEVTPTAVKPVVPVAVKPVVTAASKPVPPEIKPDVPTTVKSVAPAAVKPAMPPAVKPVEPVSVKSVTPAPVKPVAPSAAKPHKQALPKSVTTLAKRVVELKPVKQPVKSKPKAKSKSPLQAVAATARPKVEVVRSIDDRISFTAQGGPILAVAIDRKRLATLTGLFSGASLGMIAHYLVLNALAARDPLPGDGADGSIAAFVAHQEQLLSRALISTRLGKTPAPDSVGAALPAFPPALAMHTDRRAIDTPPSGQAMLFRAFQPAEVRFVQQMLSDETAAPFMRAAQLFIGLCANDVAIADEPERHRVAIALTAYAALATAEISRIFLSAKVRGAPELFKATDVYFDDAARTVLAALARSIV